MKRKSSIGIVGVGKMGAALAKKLKNKMSIEGTTSNDASAHATAKDLGIRVSADNNKLAKNHRTIILCTKPQQTEAVVKKMARSLTREHLLISIAAGITTEQLNRWSGGKCPIVRAMPNMPALVGEGMTVLCAGPHAKPEQVKQAEELFESVGRTAVIAESQMDGATGLSGSGPAYVYLVIEALSEAGVKVGLPRDTSTLLAAQTLLGAAKMVLDRGAHPAFLKDEVTTPAGCTIDGLMALEEGKLRVTLIKAVLAAASRSSQLK